MWGVCFLMGEGDGGVVAAGGDVFGGFCGGFCRVFEIAGAGADNPGLMMYPKHQTYLLRIILCVGQIGRSKGCTIMRPGSVL